MNGHNDSILSEGLLETLAKNGMDALPDALRLLLNAVRLIERQKHLGAGPYKRTPERTAHAKSFKDKTVQTRLGAVLDLSGAFGGKKDGRELTFAQVQFIG